MLMAPNFLPYPLLVVVFAVVSVTLTEVTAEDRLKWRCGKRQFCEVCRSQQGSCRTNSRDVFASFDQCIKVCEGGQRNYNCRDKRVDCPYLARRGDCDVDLNPMSYLCRRTCGTCWCEDKYAVCPTWAARNDCQHSSLLRNAVCRKSCHNCPCQDDPAFKCYQKALNGDCRQTIIGLIHQECPRSCGVCE